MLIYFQALFLILALYFIYKSYKTKDEMLGYEYDYYTITFLILSSLSYLIHVLLRWKRKIIPIIMFISH